LKKVKILSIPRYDDVTDSFVDGPLPKSADSFFNNNDRMREFFEIKKPVLEEVAPHH
jgi:hypothetical protein